MKWCSTCGRAARHREAQAYTNRVEESRDEEDPLEGVVVPKDALRVTAERRDTSAIVSGQTAPAPGSLVR